MDEGRFWLALELRVSGEMAANDECRHHGMWCDGFVAEALDLGVTPSRIRGRAWVGFGPRNQERWSFELLLPTTAATREEIQWSRLLPPDGVTSWLGVDFQAKHLIVAPGDAVDDSAQRGSEAYEPPTPTARKPEA